MNRPMGVTIVAVLVMLLGVAGVIRAGMLAGVAGAAEALFPAFGVTSAAASEGLSTIALIGLGVAVFTILVGIGLWMLQKWAWMIAIVVIVITLLLAAWDLFTMGMGSVSWLSIIISAIVLFYLLRDEVKSAFQA